MVKSYLSNFPVAILAQVVRRLKLFRLQSWTSRFSIQLASFGTACVRCFGFCVHRVCLYVRVCIISFSGVSYRIWVWVSLVAEGGSEFWRPLLLGVLKMCFTKFHTAAGEVHQHSPKNHHAEF